MGNTAARETLIAAIYLFASERVADAGNDGVPLAFFGGRIIDEDALHITCRTIAAVVPYPAIENARRYKKPRGHFLIDNSRRRLLPCQKDDG
jgi:hypothetical protein